MFRSHSDHLQGAHIFLIKVSIWRSMRDIIRHTSPNTTHVHTP